ncbi:hypothetical protein NMG60_11034507 [Bertholletia excelsa]
MAQRPHVPKFGNWESEENVPYTAYFDKARKGKTGGKMINPNDPAENPDMFTNAAPPSQAPPSRTQLEPEEPIRREAVRLDHHRRTSREDSDFRQYTESPARGDNTGRRTSGESAHQRLTGRGSGTGRPTRPSAGSEQSFEKSPLHPHYQAKVMGKGSASPGWEGKNSYDSSHGTPGRSRMRPSRGDETPDQSAAVPKFGDWDENNPASADGYTHIFNRVREERHTAASMSPNVSQQPSYSSMGKQKTHDDTKICCFPWRRK